MADAKFEVYNADGSLQFDLSNRLGRIVGTVATGTSNGSATVAGLAEGQGFWFRTETSVNTSTAKELPEVSFSGTTVSWVFRNPDTSKRRASTLLVGVR